MRMITVCRVVLTEDSQRSMQRMRHGVCFRRSHQSMTTWKLIRRIICRMMGRRFITLFWTNLLRMELSNFLTSFCHYTIAKFKKMTKWDFWSNQKMLLLSNKANTTVSETQKKTQWQFLLKTMSTNSEPHSDSRWPTAFMEPKLTILIINGWNNGWLISGTC